MSLKWGGVTGGIRGFTAGRGPVVLLLSEESIPIRRATVKGKLYLDRAVVPLGPSSVPGWGALKTVWLGLPSYQGAYLVRGRRLDGAGNVGIGDSPDQRQFAIEPGTPEGDLAKANGGNGYRPGIGYVWLKVPGCYGFQIDGTSFTDAVILDVIPPPRSTH